MTSKGTIIGAKNGDNSYVYEYDIKKKLNSWNFEGEKHVCLLYLIKIEIKNFQRLISFGAIEYKELRKPILDIRSY